MKDTTIIITSVSSAYKKLGIYESTYKGLLEAILSEGVIHIYSMFKGCASHLEKLTRDINDVAPKLFIPIHEVRVLFIPVVDNAVDQKKSERYFIEKSQDRMPKQKIVFEDLNCGLVESYLECLKNDKIKYQYIIIDLTPLSKQEYTEFTKEFNKMYPQCPSNIYLYRG